MASRRALWGLIAVTGLFRLAWAAGLGPCNDEAYYSLFAAHRDWSYFDQPPMVAVVAGLGLALGGDRASALPLRLGFIALFAGSTWLMARLTARSYGPRAGFLAAFALNVTAYHSFAAGTFALPDGPLLFFWLLTLDRLAVALDSPGAIRPWIGVGLAWGGALLSKYHAVFLPAGVLLCLAIEPPARRLLRQPGPFLAAAIGLVAFTPVVVWNATHDWASFAFQGGRALGELRFRPEALAGAILGQAAYLLPWIWFPLLAILMRGGRRAMAGEARPIDRFLICQAVVPLTVFTAVACTRSVLPHWTLVGFLSLFPMLGGAWDVALAADPARWRRKLVILATLPVAIGGIFLVWTRTGVFQEGRPGGIGLVKIARDPTADLYGWDQVARELRNRGLLGRPRTFLFTGVWYHTGQLAFATRGDRTPVLCYNAWDARNFSFWSKPDDWVGQDGILVALNNRSAEPHCYDRWFARIEPIGEFDVIRGGVSVRKVRLFRCSGQTRPFPFDNLREPRPEVRRMIAEGLPAARR